MLFCKKIDSKNKSYVKGYSKTYKLVTMISSNIRACSFCRIAGHNIKTCNDVRIQNFETTCSIEIQNFDSTNDFKSWLRENYAEDAPNLMLLKVFVIQKFHVRGRISTEICIEYIAEYMFLKYKINEQENSNEENNEDIEDDLLRIWDALRLFNSENNYVLNETLENDYNILRNNIIFRQEQMWVDFLSNELRNINNQSSLAREKYIISSFIENNENKDITVNKECNICYDEKNTQKFVRLNCNHEFCGDCIIKIFKKTIKTPCCAFCRTEVQTITSKTNDVFSELTKIIT